MEIGWPYFDYLLDHGLVDEVHLWSKTRNAKDEEYVDNLGESRDEVTVIKYQDPTWNDNWCEPYQYYADNPGHLDGEDVLIKMDDDTMFLDVDEFAGFAQFIHDQQVNDGRFTVFANTINHGASAYYQGHTKSEISEQCKQFLPPTLEWSSDCPKASRTSEGWKERWFQNKTASRNIQECLLATG